MNAAIRVNPRAPLKITKMLAHDSLPLIALVYECEDSLIEVYKMSEQMLPSVHEPDFTLHGAYREPGRSAKVIDVAWAGDLDQLLILREGETSVSLVSSQATLKMISMFGNKQGLQEELNKVLG